MKRIGDVARSIPIPPPRTSGAVTLTNAETVRCAVCQDAGFLRADVPVGHPSFGRIFPCECKKRELDERHADELRRLSNLDAFSHHTFADYDPAVGGVSEAFDAAYRFAKNPQGWLFLHGPCGVGKTHLAVSIAKYMIEQHQSSVYFAVVPDLLDHLRATFDPGSGSAYDDRFTTIRNAWLLILDDLGTENTTPWAREKLYQLINHRYNEQLPTVITSNQDFRKIEERVLSRILDRQLTNLIEVDADDFRRGTLPHQMRGHRGR